MTQKPNSDYAAFQARHNIEQRIKWIQESRRMYPEKIAVIVLPFDQSAIPLSNQKFLFPASFQSGQMMSVIRSRLELTQLDSIFLAAIKPDSLGYAQLALGTPLTTVKDKYQHNDGFLYVVYSQEQVFG